MVPNDGQTDRQTVRFDYVKSNLFRVIHADGAVGALTPGNVVQVGFYSERVPIPRRSVHELTGEGGLGEELPQAREVRDAFVREVDVNVMMSLEAAQGLCELLQRVLEQAQSRLRVAGAEGP